MTHFRNFGVVTAVILPGAMCAFAAGYFLRQAENCEERHLAHLVVLEHLQVSDQYGSVGIANNGQYLAFVCRGEVVGECEIDE